MKDRSILSALKTGETNLDSLKDLAAGKIKPGTQELTEEAAQEARDHFFDPQRYKTIITYLQHSNYQNLLPAIMQQYNAGVIDLEKLFRENSTASLTSLYPSYKAYMNAERLLLVNPTADNSRTTFVHELFSNNCPKKDIIHFFQALNDLAKLNPELMSNYLALSDTNGKSIRQILEEKSITASYLGMAEEIKRSCKFLYPVASLNQNNVIDTHTGSVHGSVDKSFVKLALRYDPRLITNGSTSHSVEVNRSAEWNRKIQTDFEALEQDLRGITASDESVAKFIEPTLAAGEDRELAHKKFKFQAETALRLIEGLKAGGYGNSYHVSANEKVSCGLTPKEAVTIGYASLRDRDLWNNPEQAQQQFIQFVENLYIAKRGYNIDKHGENEWNRPSPEADNNKCTGGTINQIPCGLRDNSLVEVKIITTETMAPILSVKLADILGNLASSNEHKTLINNWLATGTINDSLSKLILTQLKRDEEFAQEFSQSEIKTIGACALNKLKKEELYKIQQSLQNRFPNRFASITLQSNLLSDKELAYSFIFKDDKGYVPYLESLYHIDRNRFIAALQSKLATDITSDLYSNDAKKTNLMLQLLLASQDESVAEATKEIFQAHLGRFDQEIKDQYLILMAEENHAHLLPALIGAGANVNADDNRPGHANKTALHYAAGNGQIDAIVKLLELGADINYKNRANCTALNEAMHSKKFDAMVKLIELGADINAKNNEGYTALHYVAIDGKIDQMFKLLELGADINARCRDNCTALHKAMQCYEFDAAAKLLELGIDVSVRSGREGLDGTALDWAVKHKTLDELSDAIINKCDTTAVINNVINQASGYIHDDVNAWSLVEKIIKKLPKENRLEIVSEALKEIDNTSRRDRLLSFIPEEERNLARAEVSPAMWEEIRVVIHGNSNNDISAGPRRREEDNNEIEGAPPRKRAPGNEHKR